MKATFSTLFLLTASVFSNTEDSRLVLDGGNILTGEVVSLSRTNGLQFLSENALAPFFFDPNRIEAIVLAPDTKQNTDFSEILILNNGDQIPGTISKLTENLIGFDTSYSDSLEIKRTHARSIDFGVRPQRLVFKGPGKISDWHHNDNWESSGETITSSAAGTITLPNILPAQFILRFRLEWEGNPSLRFFFCDDLLKARGNTNRYYFEFNSAGMQLKRENAHDAQRWATIASVRRRPNTFPDALADIELRVDRDEGLIYLYINGKSEGHHRDHFEDFPTGSGIMIQSLAGGDIKNIISRIEIYDWDAISQVRGDEGHEDVDQDSLISSSGERFSGSAELLTKRDDGSPGIVFSSPHSDDSFTIPKNRISTLYFRRDEKLPEGSASECSVILANKGKLQLSEISMDAKTLIGQHPLLGQIQLDRGIVERLVFNSEPEIKSP